MADLDDVNVEHTVVLRQPEGWAAARPDEPVHFLLLMEGDPPHRRIPLSHPPMTVGRVPPADIVLGGGAVSRRHCKFDQLDERIVVTDLGSTNGTFINGARAETPVALQDGDIVTAGGHKLRYHRRRQDQSIEADAMARELQDAAAYVASILPPPLTEGPVLAEWFFRPSTQLAGDAFGYQQVDGRYFLAFVLDVAGHGIGAALHCVSVANVLRQRLLPDVDFRDPAAVIRALNRMFQMETHNGLFFTIWYGVYDVEQRILSFAAGGHHPAYLIPTPASEPLPLGTRNPTVGIMPDRPVTAGSAEIPRGSALYLFTDGVFEIFDHTERQWTIDDLLPLLPRAACPGGPKQVFDQIRAAARDGRLDDDFSALLLRFP